VGQGFVEFSPVTKKQNGTSNMRAKISRTASSNSSNTWNGRNMTGYANSTMGTNNETFSTPIASSTPDTGDLLSGAINDIISGLEGGISNAENEIDGFLREVVQNITTSLEDDLSTGGGDLGQLLSTAFQNLTGGIENSLSGARLGSFLQDILQDLSPSSVSGSWGGISNLLQGVIGNFSTGIAAVLSKAEGTAAQGIAEALGIQQLYSLHLRQVCSGTLSSSSDPHATFNITGCFTYSEAAAGFSFIPPSGNSLT